VLDLAPATLPLKNVIRAPRASSTPCSPNHARAPDNHHYNDLWFVAEALVSQPRPVAGKQK
jgi:hypothetical protein